MIFPDLVRGAPSNMRDLHLPLIKIQLIAQCHTDRMANPEKINPECIKII